MALPTSFQFTQGNLQDYVDCPRRFQLRHLLMQPWPALVAAPADAAEQHMQRGRDFHRLAHQHELGIEHHALAQSIHDPVLMDWWQCLLANHPKGLPSQVRRAEFMLAVPFMGFRLAAKYDLLAVDVGKRIAIVDWKTTLKPPSHQRLGDRLQTRVYRYLAVEAGATYNGGQHPRPEQVEMVYWFASLGGNVQRFPYSTLEHQASESYLTELATSIIGQDEEIWPLTNDEGLCRFCNYRSLCDRGVKPGLIQDMEDDLDFDDIEIDLEQIAEIEF
jgi:hypothetical protein